MHDISAPVDSLSFNHLMGGLKRRKLIIFSFMLIAFCTSFFLATTLPYQYEARALIQIQVPEQNLSGEGNTVIINQSVAPPESLVLTEVEALRSRDLITDVVKDLDIVRQHAFWGKGLHIRNETYAVDFILDHLNVRPVGRSVVLAVEYRHHDPQIAERITNRIIQIYQEKQVSEKISNIRKTNAWLEERLDILSGKLRDSARAVEEYRAKADLIDGAKVELTSQQISEISSQLITAQADLASAQAKETQLSRLSQDKKTLEAVADVSKSPLIALLKRDESVLLRRQADLRSRYGRNHPKILAISAEISELRDKQKTEIQRITETMNHEVLAAQAKVDTLQKNLHDLETKRRQENRAAIGLRELQREAEANRILYENFLNRYKESGEGSLFQHADAKIIAAATVPNLPVGPPRAVIVIFVSFLGLMTGIVIALFLELLENYIRTPAQIIQMDGTARVIGMIPETQEVKSLAGHFGFIRQSILNDMDMNKPVALGITSSMAGEGKTFFAEALARHMAHIHPGRVLYIDAGLHEPHTDATAQHNLYDIIQSAQPLLQFTRAEDSMHVIRTLREKREGISHLSPRDIAAFVAKCKMSFDLIIFDLDAFLTSPESVLFLKNMDSTIYMVRWDFLPQNVLKTALSQLAFYHIPSVSFVISRVKSHIHRLYKYSDIIQLNHNTY